MQPRSSICFVTSNFREATRYRRKNVIAMEARSTKASVVFRLPNNCNFPLSEARFAARDSQIFTTEKRRSYTSRHPVNKIHCLRQRQISFSDDSLTFSTSYIFHFKTQSTDISVLLHSSITSWSNNITWVHRFPYFEFSVLNNHFKTFSWFSKIIIRKIIR